MSASGRAQMPPRDLLRGHARSAAALVYPRSSSIQSATCARTQTSSSEPNQERDLALCRLRRVGAVTRLFGIASAKSPRISRARPARDSSRRSSSRDAAIAPSPSSTSAKVGPEVNEVDRARRRTVSRRAPRVPFGQSRVTRTSFAARTSKAAALENATGSRRRSGPRRVRLDQDQGLLPPPSRRVYDSGARRRRRRAPQRRTRSARAPRRRGRSRWRGRSTRVSQNGHTARALERRVTVTHACLSFVVRRADEEGRVDLRAADGAVSPAPQPLLPSP